MQRRRLEREFTLFTATPKSDRRLRLRLRGKRVLLGSGGCCWGRWGRIGQRSRVGRMIVARTHPREETESVAAGRWVATN